MRLITTSWLALTAIAALARVPMRQRAVVAHPATDGLLTSSQATYTWAPLFILIAYFFASAIVLYVLILARRKYRSRRQRQTGPLELPGSEVELLPTAVSPTLEREILMPLPRSPTSSVFARAPPTPFTPPTSPPLPLLSRPLSPFMGPSPSFSLVALQAPRRTSPRLSFSAPKTPHEEVHSLFQRSKSTPPVPRSRAHDMHLRHSRSHSRSDSDASSSSSSSGIELISMHPLAISNSSPLPYVPVAFTKPSPNWLAAGQKSGSPTDLIDFATPTLPTTAKGEFADPLGVSLLPSLTKIDREASSGSSSRSVDLVDMREASTSLHTAPVVVPGDSVMPFQSQPKFGPSFSLSLQQDRRTTQRHSSPLSSPSSSTSTSPGSAQILLLPPSVQSTPGTTPMRDEFSFTQLSQGNVAAAEVVQDGRNLSEEKANRLPEPQNQPPNLQAAPLLKDLINWADDPHAVWASPFVDAEPAEWDEGATPSFPVEKDDVGGSQEPNLDDAPLIDFSPSVSVKAEPSRQEDDGLLEQDLSVYARDDSEVDTENSRDISRDFDGSYQQNDFPIAQVDEDLIVFEGVSENPGVRSVAGDGTVVLHSAKDAGRLPAAEAADAADEVCAPSSEDELIVGNVPETLIDDPHSLTSTPNALMPSPNNLHAATSSPPSSAALREETLNVTFDETHDTHDTYNSDENDDALASAIGHTNDPHDISMHPHDDIPPFDAASQRQTRVELFESSSQNEPISNIEYPDPDLFELPTSMEVDVNIPPIVISAVSSMVHPTPVHEVAANILSQLDIECTPPSPTKGQGPRTATLQTPTPPSSPPPSPLRRTPLLANVSLSIPVNKPAWAIRAANAPSLGLESAALHPHQRENWRGAKLEKLLDPSMEDEDQSEGALLSAGTSPSTKPSVELDEAQREATPADDAFAKISAEDVEPSHATPEAIPGSFVETSALRLRSGTPAEDVAKPVNQTISVPAPGRRPHQRSALDIALAMQLRPGLGIGADPAWLVRFLMSVFGWFAILISGTGEWAPAGALVGR
ncbi:hypothetical protein HGRIS_012560 [Hohenbuehelia grisea]|uniref:Proteophosphoglycan ppg4 n=1 Tax=Hohenbuehelia grisea TaxID=104357 RepID=A0ABR3ISW5_9AGAR